MRMKYLALAAGALLMSSGAASAATVSNPLHLRSGPGTRYSVIATMPAGAQVGIRTCTGGWCRVNFRGETGWAAANFLGQNRSYSARYRVYRSDPRYSRYYAAPGYTAYAAAPGYGYDDEGPYADEGVGIGIGPVGFGIGFGPGWAWNEGWRHGWHHY